MLYYYTYLSLLLATCMLSIFVKKAEYHLRVIKILLICASLAEAIVYVLVFHFDLRPEFYIVYHLYVPLEFVLIMWFYSHYPPISTNKRLVVIITVIICTCQILLSAVKGYYILPGIQLNLTALFVIVALSSVMLTLEPQYNKSIFSLPIFWISCGF
ncbi:unnamed protein product, partial [Laminaria digitata]